ncbi:dTDP-4-dehydrorhamnose reductase [Ensifer sp. 22460]|uniref:dTDP-4-dehydrorhamnose reductase n=1 Tax=Ensifer sp. 22460 TaxID=3453922 RepID=UPI003F864F74
MRPPLRFVVTGVTGQVVQALIEKGREYSDVEVIPLGRPYLNLENTDSIAGIIRAASPDIIVSAAAYTDVDRAEGDAAAAFAINSRAPEALARVARAIDIPIIHLSTDYVFDGCKRSPHVETDETNPLGIYGQSKLDGERLVVINCDNHAILRTAWIYSPFGKNFVQTMLHYAARRDELAIVADQFGNPTSALNLATAIICVGRKLLASDCGGLRGTFHLTGAGEASWAEFAEEIFKISKIMGGPFASVRRISAADYPTIARRPQNSRLSCQRIQERYGISLPHWTVSTEETVRRLVQKQVKER